MEKTKKKEEKREIYKKEHKKKQKEEQKKEQKEEKKKKQKEETKKISIKDAKKEGDILTEILDEYTKVYIETIYSRDNRARVVYKVTTKEDLYILKTIKVQKSNDDEGNDEDICTEQINGIMDEYNISKKCSGNCPYFSKPLDYKQGKTRHFIQAEILYEYDGISLDKMLGKLTYEEILGIMDELLIPMQYLQENHINHSDFKPGNILYKEGKLKVIDFGSSKIYKNREDLTKTVGTKDSIHEFSLPYSPPEVVFYEPDASCKDDQMKRIPIKVDVYCWGMTLLHLIIGMKNSEFVKFAIQKDIKEEEKYNEMFLEKLKTLKLEKDTSGEITKCVVNILTRVLKFKPRERPNFKELRAISMMGKIGSSIKTESNLL